MRLADGSNEYHGELPSPGGGSRRLGVVLLGAGERPALQLRGKTAEPECGFCKFMKAGPCGAVFQAWEDCIDRARDSGVDFVELCGKVNVLPPAFNAARFLGQHVWFVSFSYVAFCPVQSERGNYCRPIHRRYFGRAWWPAPVDTPWRAGYSSARISGTRKGQRLGTK